MSKRNVTWDGLNLSGTDLFQTAKRLRCPQITDVWVSQWIETFNQAVGQKRPRIAREGEDNFGDLFDRDAHAQRIRLFGCRLNFKGG